VAGQRIGIDLDLVPHGTQPGHAPAEGGFVAHRARGREDVDVLGAVVVAAGGVVVIVVV